MRSLLALALALLAASPTFAPAFAKDRLSYAFNLDPTHEAFVWAIGAGKVTSDLIDVDLRAVTIPVVTQALTTRQFDATEQGFLLLEDTEARGLPVQVIGINLRYKPQPVGFGLWVKASSPIATAEDLKGRTVATVGLRSTVFSLMRMALREKHGLNVALNGGDMNIVEVPGPGMLPALLTGRVDAAALSHIQSYEARHNPEYRELVDTGHDLLDVFHEPAITAVMMAYPDRLAAKPAEYRELLRMLKASSDYAVAHIDEVAAALAAKDHIDVAFFADWFKNYGEFPVAVSAADIATINHEWQLAKEIGVANNPQDVSRWIWDGALRQ